MNSSKTDPMNARLSELLSYLEVLPGPRMVMDADYRIVAANAAYLREFAGDDGDGLAGRHCYEVSHRFSVPCDQAGESCPLKLSLASGRPQRVLHLHHTPRGEEHVAVDTTPIRNAAGEIAYFVESMQVLRQSSSRPAAQGLVGRAPAFVRMLEKVMRVAPSAAAVLLLGETGTGKELVAHAIHEASKREKGPFVPVDCAGMTETLFESELFGYEKGAFTGAAQRKPGLVEAAAGGTLFLDEIGELPLSQQVKLLRLLESGSFRRVGGLDHLPADFRLVCATHQDLRAMVAAGSFRRDLYFRINTFPIRTPALHEREEDIPLLAASLLERVDQRPGRCLTPAALDWLQTRRYEGNIRELRNLIEGAALLADGDTVDRAHLREMAGELAPTPSSADWPSSAPPGDSDDTGGDEIFRSAGLQPLDALEAGYLRWAHQRLPDDVGELARALGISPRTLYRKLRAAGA